MCVFSSVQYYLVVEFLQSRFRSSLCTVCPSVYRAYFLLKQKIPSNSCDHSCMSTAFLSILPKAIMNTLLTKPGKICAIILIDKIKSMVIFCI